MMLLQYYEQCRININSEDDLSYRIHDPEIKRVVGIYFLDKIHDVKT